VSFTRILALRLTVLEIDPIGLTIQIISLLLVSLSNESGQNEITHAGKDLN